MPDILVFSTSLGAKYAPALDQAPNFWRPDYKRNQPKLFFKKTVHKKFRKIHRNATEWCIFLRKLAGPGQQL